jgi:predicted nucleotidyltransferase component of viral defense system
MGKTILTPKQLNFLELAASEKQITKRFYLTGGTALAEFYLKHRFSEDIDLFNEKAEVDPKIIEAFLRKISSKLDIVHIKRSQFLGLFSYNLIYKNKEELKVDFNYYPFPRIEKGKQFGNLEIDSVYDIAVNKLHTLFMKPRGRDYIDLFFILKRTDYSLKKLILDAKAKFDWDIDKINLASQFTRVKEFSDTPLLLKKLNRKDMENFFLGLAKSLEKDIFKK